ncbi:MAG: dihydrofolate reductase, partial [Clostridia bacterium]|nr:dihydrofolate reductase [Clostridia bacterium]
MFTIIAAIGRSNELGKDGDLIWHLPSDMKFFRETTSGHTIIMGRKTFDSLGRVLPNRHHVVLTHAD